MNNGEKSLLRIWLGYYPKLELHFSIFWHQNGRVITLRILKNMLPKLRVIIERWLLPLAAWQCRLQRWLCLENWATSALAWIKTDVISNILTFRLYPKVSRLILFACDKQVFNVKLRKACGEIQISLNCLVGVVMWENISWTEYRSDQSRKFAAAKFVLHFCTSH